MRLIRDLYAARPGGARPIISFEFFPPKTEEGERNLLDRAVPELKAGRPDYCSVTYGAGGGTREKTLRLVDRLQREHGMTALAHLTCVNHTREQLHDLLAQIRALGCHNILALRGDPPPGQEFTRTEGGFEYAAELVRFIRELDGFSIGVAGFPEGHLACRTGKLADWSHLKAKIDAGADYVLTQLFFDNEDFFAFRDHLTRELKVTVPIIPGVIPILGAGQIRRFTQLCGARIPDALGARLDALADDDATAAEYGIEYATRQCEGLLRAGCPGLHFYTLNKSRSTLMVLRNLGLT